MRSVCLALIGLAVASLNCDAQTDAVFLVKMYNCGPAKTERAQTGFLIAGKRGLVTALHGVADCTDDFTARNNANLVITRLKRSKVDVDRDLVLMDSPELDQFSTIGITAGTGVSWSALKSVRVYGYPRETKLEGRPISVLDPPIKELSATLPPNPPELRDALKLRGSPSHLVRILHLADGLVPGHSGAPVLDEQSRVIAVADGGLKDVGTSWAIPLQDADWEDAANNKRVSQLSGLKLDVLFASERGPDLFGGSLSVVADANCVVSVRGREQTLAKGTEGSWAVAPGLVHIHAETQNRISDDEDVRVPLGPPVVWRTRLIEKVNARLIAAIHAGDLSSVRASLAAGADMSAPADEGKQSALSLAAGLDRLEVLRALISVTTTLGQKDPGGCTALARAIHNRRSENAVLLLQSGSPVQVCGDNFPLQTAVAQDDPKLVAALIRAGADPYEKDANNSTSFDRAIDSGSREVITAFISSGRVRKGDGLSRAVWQMHRPEAIRAFVDAGEVPNAMDVFCGQYLDEAANHKDGARVFKALEAAGFPCTERRQLIQANLPGALDTVSSAVNRIGSVRATRNASFTSKVTGVEGCKMAFDLTGFTHEKALLDLNKSDASIVEATWTETLTGLPLWEVYLSDANIFKDGADHWESGVAGILVGNKADTTAIASLFSKAAGLCRLASLFE